MRTLTRSLQILIDDERYRRLEQEAARRGVPVAVLVWAVIDDAFPSDRGARADAGRRILDAESMSVPEPEQLRAELEDIRSGRS